MFGNRAKHVYLVWMQGLGCPDDRVEIGIRVLKIESTFRKQTEMLVALLHNTNTAFLFRFDLSSL